MEIRPILSALLHNKTGALLIAAQVALTLAIISNAAHVIRERLATSERPTGVDAEDRIITQRPVLNSKVDLAALQQVDLDALRAIPGVESATLTNQVPLGRSGWSASLAAEPKVTSLSCNAGMYFDGGDLLPTLGLRLVEGRGFTADEIVQVDPDLTRDQPKIALITLALAKKFFPDAQSYVGRSYYSGNPTDAEETRIIGVIERLQTPWAQTNEESDYNVVLPIRYLNAFNYYVVRAEPGAAEQVRRATNEVLEKNEPDRVSHGEFTITDLRNKRYRGERGVAWLLLSVTVFLLVVTASGIVGMATLWVNLRRKQIGVRRALGATRGDIVRYFVTENLLITGTGIIAGVIAARAMNMVLMQQLSLPRMPWADVAGGVVLLAALGVAAVLWPALRASKLSPALATRSI